MEEEISLVELFDILKKNMLLIIITTILTTIIAVIYTFFIVTPQYESSTEVLVSQSAAESQKISQQDISLSLNLINTYSVIIRNEVVLESVIEELELDTSVGTLRQNIDVQTENNSQVFSIRVQDENPYAASKIANSTADIFKDNIQEIMNVDNVTIISNATPNLNPVSPNKPLNLVIGVLLGLMIGIGIVFLRELLDNTVKSEEAVEALTGWANLGQVNTFSKNDLLVKTPLPKQQPTPSSDSNEDLTRTRRRV